MLAYHSGGEKGKHKIIKRSTALVLPQQGCKYHTGILLFVHCRSLRYRLWLSSQPTVSPQLPSPADERFPVRVMGPLNNLLILPCLVYCVGRCNLSEKCLGNVASGLQWWKRSQAA